jgi:exopolyphosphatase/pppGpp-phosphohydrolase
MSITHTVDVDRLLLIFEVSGTITTDEMLAAVDRAVPVGDGRRYDVLSDHRALVFPATAAQLEALVSHLTRYRAVFGGMRWAVVVGQPASFGMMRMLSVLAERIPIEVEVFTDPEEASRWLGRHPTAS